MAFGVTVTYNLYVTPKAIIFRILFITNTITDEKHSGIETDTDTSLCGCYKTPLSTFYHYQQKNCSSSQSQKPSPPESEAKHSPQCLRSSSRQEQPQPVPDKQVSSAKISKSGSEDSYSAFQTPPLAEAYSKSPQREQNIHINDLLNKQHSPAERSADLLDSRPDNVTTQVEIQFVRCCHRCSDFIAVRDTSTQTPLSPVS